jgi:hypothetical protein
MTDPHLTNDLGVMESFSKLFAVGLGVLYLLGFLVVASYLSRYGVSSFSVLHLQYLIAGFWVLGPMVVLESLNHASNRFEQRAAPDANAKGIFNWRRFAISTTISAVPYALFVGLVGAIPNVADSLTWRIGYRILLFYIATGFCARLFWRSRQLDDKKGTWLLNRTAAPFYLVFLALLLVSYSVWFSVRIYPLIPFSLGGGRPLTIVFIEGEKKMPAEIQKTDSSAKRSIPYNLLLSTDKSYVVVSPSQNERSMEVNRDDVAGIVVLK